MRRPLRRDAQERRDKLLAAAQRSRLRQIGLQAEGPGAFNEPEVVAELKLTAEQRDQIRTIEEAESHEPGNIRMIQEYAEWRFPWRLSRMN